MMRCKIIILSFFLLACIAFSQQPAEIDTAYALSFYPMHVGNYWEYYVDDGQGGHTFNITIIGDTLMDNNKTYKIFKTDSKDTDTPWWLPLYYERVDSVNGWIYQYDLGKRFAPGEYEVDSLYTNVGDYYSGGRYCYIPDLNCCIYVKYDTATSILGEKSIVRCIVDRSSVSGYEYKLGKRFGLIYFYAPPSPKIQLVYCVINGVEYGTPVNVKKNKVIKSSHLLSAYPNPFNNSTQITYSLLSDTKVKLGVYNIKGALVSTLFNGFRVRGGYSHTFTANNLPSGIYFVRLETAEHIQTKKINLIQ